MKRILVAGAGKSSTYLIRYLLNHAAKNRWTIVVADSSEKAVLEKIKDHPSAEKAVLNITDEEQRQALVKDADLVVSLMPPHLHIFLAKDCLKFNKNLITSSYISPEMKEMDKDVKNAGLMFMCEMGLDPGIDHMTASQIIHTTQRVAAVITSFKSYCGGLVAPENDNNPWHYKFSWNPRNIVTAGLGGAHYLENNKQVHVPYESIFASTHKVNTNGLGNLAYYPNRDSLRYLDLYDIPDVKTFVRATLRYPDFCKGWQAIINLGLTTDADSLEHGEKTYLDWVKNKTGFNDYQGNIANFIAEKLNVKPTGKVINMLGWLGIWDDKPLPEGKTNSADILLSLLEQKWELQPQEKDMVVMQHDVEYEHKGRNIKLTSTMIIEGENREYSAMAKTVGLPMGILAKFVMDKKLTLPKGVCIPNMPAVYKPVLKELEQHGITFNDKVE